MKNIAVALCMVMALAASGCFGGPVPVEQYLRLGVPGQSDQALEASLAADKPTVVVRRIKAMPVLDRSAVLVARRQVMTPSLVWYWEGTPAEVVEQALVRGLAGSGSLNAMWPYSPRVEADAHVRGRVRVFEVRNDRHEFFMQCDLDLWDGKGGKLLARRTFISKAPLGELTPDEVAQAASTALDKTVGDMTAWVEQAVADIK